MSGWGILKLVGKLLLIGLLIVVIVVGLYFFARIFLGSVADIGSMFG